MFLQKKWNLNSKDPVNVESNNSLERVHPSFLKFLFILQLFCTMHFVLIQASESQLIYSPGAVRPDSGLQLMSTGGLNFGRTVSKLMVSFQPQ